MLVHLDPTEYELELAASKAKLLKAQKDLEDLLAWKRPEEIRRLTAAREEALAREERNQSDFKRMESLIDQRATSQQEFGRVRAELRSARAAVERAEADLAEAEAGPTEAANCRITGPCQPGRGRCTDQGRSPQKDGHSIAL